LARETDTGCIVIEGQGRRRYAMVSIGDGIRVPAHRLASTVTRGSVPEGGLRSAPERQHTLCLPGASVHRRSAPQHARRGEAGTAEAAGAEAPTVVSPKGHAMTAENTMSARSRYRCRECHQANLRVRAGRRQNLQCTDRAG
jgi:hypothetical protein